MKIVQQILRYLVRSYCVVRNSHYVVTQVRLLEACGFVGELSRTLFVYNTLCDITLVK